MAAPLVSGGDSVLSTERLGMVGLVFGPPAFASAEAPAVVVPAAVLAVARDDDVVAAPAAEFPADAAPDAVPPVAPPPADPPDPPPLCAQVGARHTLLHRLATRSNDFEFMTFKKIAVRCPRRWSAPQAGVMVCC